ncbi:MAG: 50S ribosomal protein L17 [Bacteroidetes bacterium]|nr:MAG: 50S ribosomal protein L17 [Bacteroidota bacterium]
MRHRKNFNHLGRKANHRNAMLANMASSLILNKSITTTVAKAKALRMYVEPIITKSKKDTTHSRRVVFSYLQNKHSVSELFREVAVKVGERPGGYTRILKLGKRLGDNADMCIIELVDYNENMLEASKPKAKTTRRRRSKKASSSTAQTNVKATETKVEETATEVKAEDTKAETKVEEKKEEAKKEVKAEKKSEEPKAPAKKEEKNPEEEKKSE